MTKDEFHTVAIESMAKIIKLVSEEPGITDRQILKRCNKRHACLAWLHLACQEGMIVERRTFWSTRYYSEDYFTSHWS